MPVGIDILNSGAGASALSWDKYTEGMFTGTYGKKMTGYKVTDYSYTGGAHGMNSETCLVFNMKTGDRVSLDDIFRDDSRDILTSLLTRHAKDGKTGNDTAVKDGNGTPAVQKAGSDAFCHVIQRATVDQMEQYLNQSGFQRIHKSVIVGICHIRRFDKRNHLIELKNGEIFSISDRYYGHVREKLCFFDT